MTTTTDSTLDLELDTLAMRFESLAEQLKVGEIHAADVLKSLDLVHYSLRHAMQLAVVDMRRDGATWETVASALNISRQAAQQRFGR